MSHSQALADHIRQVHFGGNWTYSNVKDQLADVTMAEALTKYKDLNTIATLQFHMAYYIDVIVRVLEGGPLEGKDELSFKHPEINSETDWRTRVEKHLDGAEHLAALVEKLPDAILHTDFADPKYGSYLRNMKGFVEHTHYHLGQIALIKKLIRGSE